MTKAVKIEPSKVGDKATAANGSLEETFDKGQAFMAYPGTIIECIKLAKSELAGKSVKGPNDGNLYTIRIDAWSTPENPRTIKAVKTAEGFRLVQ